MRRNKLFKLSVSNVFFLKCFVKYILLLMLPLGAIGSYSLYRSNLESRQNIETRNWNLMYQFKNQADSLFQTVDIINSFLLDSPAINAAIRSAFLDDELTSQNVDQMQTLSLYLRSIINANKYAYSCYLYYDNDFGRYIVTQNGLSYIRSYSDETWLASYRNSDLDFWCETTWLSTYSLSLRKEMLAMYQKLYSPYSATLPRGVLVAFFSLENMREYINNFDLYPDQTILFIQEDGSVLFQTDDGDYSDIWQQIRTQVNSGTPYMNFEAAFRDEPYVFSLISSSEDGYYYLSLVPRRNLYEHTRSLTVTFLTIGAISIILSVILSMRSARNDYNQLQSIIKIFTTVDSDLWQREVGQQESRQENAPFKKNDPYQVILRNVINLFIEQHYLQLQITNKQYQMQLLEMQSLQHQINPHFLFNTLNMIYWEAIHFTNQPNTCSAMISDLSEIMAYSLTDAQDKVPVGRELEYLRHYTNIQELRYAHKFSILWDISEEALDLAIIKMVFQPLIENAIYHGIKEKAGTGIIKIKIYWHVSYMDIHILDNGIGMTGEQLLRLRDRLRGGSEPLNHIGLLNTSRRLVLTSGEASAVRLYSKYGSGTVVSFRIPAEKLPEESQERLRRPEH